MYHLHLSSIPTNQAAIIALFRVMNRYLGNLPPMPGMFPDYPDPVIRNTRDGHDALGHAAAEHHGAYWVSDGMVYVQSELGRREAWVRVNPEPLARLL